jgi:hypothetical protein
MSARSASAGPTSTGTPSSSQVLLEADDGQQGRSLREVDEEIGALSRPAWNYDV